MCVSGGHTCAVCVCVRGATRGTSKLSEIRAKAYRCVCVCVRGGYAKDLETLRNQSKGVALILAQGHENGFQDVQPRDEGVLTYL